MKRILRFLCVSVFLLFCWPFFLYKRYGNVDYRPQGRTVIVCNHYSTYDAFFIYLMYRKSKIHFVTIINVKEKLLPRFVTWLFDCVFIDHGTNYYGYCKKCLSILNGGGILCIFPEGEINPLKFGFLEFRNSFMLFAAKTHADILPIYLYPELVPFRFSRIYVGEVLTERNYGAYRELEEATMLVESKIMEYSFLVPQRRQKKRLPHFKK